MKTRGQLNIQTVHRVIIDFVQHTPAQQPYVDGPELQESDQEKAWPQNATGAEESAVAVSS